MKAFQRLAVLSLVALGAFCARSEVFEYTVSYTRDDVKMNVSPAGEVAVMLKGCELAPTNPGDPWLPAKDFSIRVPEGESIVNWTVESGDPELLAEKVLPVFAPRPHKTGGVDDDKYVPATRNEAVYGSKDPYPAKRADLVRSGNMRGVTIASFRVSPIWCVGAEKKLYFTPSVKVKITTGVLPRATVANPAGGAVAVSRSQLFENMINAQVVNPVSPADGRLVLQAVNKAGSGCQYLVITKESFLAPARKLSEFRKAFDQVTSEVVTMEYIKDHYSGIDDAAKLRDCIKSYVQNKGTEYVVLAGDDRVVPIREVSVRGGTYDSYDDAPSDLYYSDLDGTWDGNGNGTFGECYASNADDSCDFLPDVIVGRIPVRTPQQLATYVDKVIRYEETTTDDSDIVRKTLWFGYTLWDTLVHIDDNPETWYRIDMGYERGQAPGHTNVCSGTVLKYMLPTERHNDGLMEYMDRPVGADANDAEFWCRRINEIAFRSNANYRTSFAFGSATSWDRNKLGDYQLNGDTSWGRTNTVQEILNRGCHFAGLDTHGNYAYVAFEGYVDYLHPKGILGPDGYYRGSSSYYAKDAITLTNRADIICTEACITGGFDLDGNASSPAKRNADDKEDPNFAEGFLRAPNGGSVVFVGCAREGFSNYMSDINGFGNDPSDWQDASCFAGYSKNYVRGFWLEATTNRNYKIGTAFAVSKSSQVRNCTPTTYGRYYAWLQMLTNLLGDPLITIHTPPARNQESTRELTEHSLVTLLRDPSLELTSSSAKIHVAADGIILGESAEVKLEYSTASNFSGAQSVTVASNVKNLGEFSKTLTGLTPGTKYYVRGKMMVTPKSGSATTCTSPFSMSFTTLPANSVGGRIAQNGVGLAGITVTARNADGTSAGTATTDADGQYSIALSAGWTGTVAPTMPTGKGAFPGYQTVSIPSGGSATADFEVKAIVYVNCRATNGKNNGSSWMDAYTSLADAFTVSPAGTVIWVAEGVYAPAELYGRDSHFSPADGVQVYGGFAGGETSLAQRDWIAHPTVLTGDIGTKGTATDNCYHVIRWASGVLLDGVGITGGRMDFKHSSSTYDYGAAIGNPASNPCSDSLSCHTCDILTNGYHMVLDHCAVTNNYGHRPGASGNSYRYGTLLARPYLIRNTLIADNDMDSYDDGMVKQSYLDNCTITANKNYGAFVKDCIIRNTIIYGNTKSLSDAKESNTTYGNTSPMGQKFMVYMYMYSSNADNSLGSTNFLTESIYCYYASSCPFTWYRGTAGQNTPDWATVDGFQYALTNGSYAAEKGAPLDWMDASSLDYLGNPRVQGAAPDLGCCEALSGDTPPDPAPFVTLSAATATVSEDGASATLSVTVEDTNVSGGALALTLNGAEVKSWTLAKGEFSQAVDVTPGSTNTFSFVASGSGVTETANGTFVTKLYVGWFDVKFGDSGFFAGEDWIAQSTDKSGGTFTASDELGSTLVKGASSYVTASGEVVYTPSHASAANADVKVDGRVQVSSVKALPELPEGTKAAICFVGGVPQVRSSTGWTALGSALTDGAWVDYLMEFDYSSESAPRVRYTVGSATSEYLVISASTRDVKRLRFRSGSFGDFKAAYVSGGDTPIELVRPEFVTDGSALAFGGTAGSETFSMTIANPVKGAYYTVFTSTTLEGTFTAEKASVLCDSSAATYTLTVDADTPSKFAKIVISTTPFAQGAPLPEK